MKGTLIVIEGTDGSGKSTQFTRLCRKLDEQGADYRHVVFPRYDEPSSMLVRMYLNGEFGKHPEDVTPYAASTFFAVDRYASYQKDWRAFYENGGLVLADRYTTSNAVHQASKLPEEEQENFVRWLFDFEYRLLGLPEPDLVLLLDVPTNMTSRLIAGRGKGAADIHEKDEIYLEKSRKTALDISRRFGWKRISCTEEGRLRTVEEIGAEIDREIDRLVFMRG